MREEELLPAVHTHLGALPLRLRDNVLARYDYQPMPPMAYSALKGELWCFRYYLRKLCTPEHERHPLVEPVRFRNVRSRGLPVTGRCFPRTRGLLGARADARRCVCRRSWRSGGRRCRARRPTFPRRRRWT